jgi:lipopolysaccharide export system permease protein
MKKIDWYIIKKFLFTFFFCLVLFTAIAIAVDSSEHTEDFVKSGLSSGQIISNYYIGFVPYIWGLLFPLFVFIAVIFFTSRMAVKSEVIAILASGTSYNRFLRPYFIGGVLLGGLLLLANRYIIPKGNEIRGNFSAKYMDQFDPYKNRDYSNTFYRRSDSNSYVGIRYYDSIQKTAGGFFLHRIKDDRMVYNLRAETMRWDTIKKTWLLANVVERNVRPDGETMQTYDTLKMDLSIRPADLRKDYYLKDKLTTPQLKEFIRLEELRGTEGLNTLKVERYRRSATPFTVLLLTLIGAVIAGRKTRGGSGLHLALGFIIASVFILTDKFSTTFSVKGNLPPLLAAWLPNIMFAAVAYWLYRKSPK